jgi:hypothetical protein
VPGSAFNLGKLLFALEGRAVAQSRMAFIHNLSTMSVENSFIDFGRRLPYNQFFPEGLEATEKFLRKV